MSPLASTGHPAKAPQRLRDNRSAFAPGAPLKDVFGRYGIVVILIVLLVASAFAYPNFLAVGNVMNLLSENAPAGIMAIGMTFVILTGGFDLSIGGIYAGTATLAASIGMHQSVGIAIVCALGAGLVAGAINGTIVTVLKVNPFVATLGTGLGFTGVALIYSNAAPFIVNKAGFQTIGTGGIGPVPYSVLLLAALFLAGQVALAFTRYGRAIYAIGSNDEASRLAGLPTMRLRWSAYVISGLCAGFAGYLVASRLGEGQANIGSTIALDVIAMVVVGGTSLTGGEGAVWRSGVGLMILATLSNVFDSLSLNANWQLVIKGSIIIAAVASERLLRRKR